MLLKFLHTHQDERPLFIDEIIDMGKVQIVRLKGPIDMYTIPNIEKLLQKAKKNQGFFKKNILLDFKTVLHVDSSTVAMLLEVLSYIKHEHHKLALVNVSVNLKAIIDIDKLSDTFAVFESEKEALSILSGIQESS